MYSDSDTDAVTQWLKRDDVWPHVERLVRAWNEGGQTSYELAHHLKKTIEAAKASKSKDTPLNLDGVDWGYVARYFAYEVCGITEVDLRRMKRS